MILSMFVRDVVTPTNHCW